jgi:hypothetical protein
VVAAIIEMLVQSYSPGILQLLPAIPTMWSRHGQVRGIRQRGDVRVSFLWENHDVEVVLLEFQSRHPWWRGVVEQVGRVGSFVFENNVASKITVWSNNSLIMLPSIDGHDDAVGIESPQCDAVGIQDTPISNEYIKSLSFSLANSQQYPCAVVLCDRQLSEDYCRDILRGRLLSKSSIAVVESID